MFAFWPFDFSCSGFVFVMFLLLAWFGWAIQDAASKAAAAAKKLAKNEAVHEVGKGIVAAWLESFFR